MDLCSERHDEVCYDGRTCPVCDAKAETEKQVAESDKQYNEITDLKAENGNLQDQLVDATNRAEYARTQAVTLQRQLDEAQREKVDRESMHTQNRRRFPGPPR